MGSRSEQVMNNHNSDSTPDGLTADQRRTVADIIERWRVAHDSAEPAERSLAEAGIWAAYLAAELVPPSRIEWVASPRAGLEVIEEFEWRKLSYPPESDASLARKVSDHPLWSTSLEITIRGSEVVSNQIEAAMSQRLGQLPERFYDDTSATCPGDARGVHTRLARSARAKNRKRSSEGLVKESRLDGVTGYAAAMARATAHDSLDAFMPPPVFGQHSAVELAYLDARIATCPVVDGAHLDGIFDVARSACWWWPFEDVVVISERPVARHVDERGRKSLEFSDGFGRPARSSSISAPAVIELSDVSGCRSTVGFDDHTCTDSSDWFVELEIRQYEVASPLWEGPLCGACLAGWREWEAEEPDAIQVLSATPIARR